MSNESNGYLFLAIALWTIVAILGIIVYTEPAKTQTQMPNVELARLSLELEAANRELATVHCRSQLDGQLRCAITTILHAIDDIKEDSSRTGVNLDIIASEVKKLRASTSISY